MEGIIKEQTSRVNMKKLLLIIFFALGLEAIAQTVSYSYRPLAAEGCNMKRIWQI